MEVDETLRAALRQAVDVPGGVSVEAPLHPPVNAGFSHALHATFVARDVFNQREKAAWRRGQNWTVAFALWNASA